MPPSGIRRFFDIAATMADVISLGIGEPDFDTPPQVVEAGIASLKRGRTHYTSNYGTIELRRALAQHLENCSDCANEWQQRNRLSARLKAAVHRQYVPSDLQMRVRGQLDGRTRGR